MNKEYKLDNEFHGLPTTTRNVKSVVVYLGVATNKANQRERNTRWRSQYAGYLRRYT